MEKHPRIEQAERDPRNLILPAKYKNLEREIQDDKDGSIDFEALLQEWKTIEARERTVTHIDPETSSRGDDLHGCLQQLDYWIKFEVDPNYFEDRNRKAKNIEEFRKGVFKV